tara:strand:- start:209 stop:472 length:264 start_codon:yes stop_codon:yes gene_type:complete
MRKIVSIVFIILVIIFFGSTYKYYSSNKNIKNKDFNRNNINQLLNEKISNLPILKNDTDNVIEFNDGFSNEIKNDKPRSFWNLLKSQ